jgi:hypothetical protein
MTITAATTSEPTTNHGRTPMTPMRKAALIAGVAYIATFIFSIPVKFGFWADVIGKPDFVVGAGSSAGIPIGALFEVLTGLGGVVSAVALYTIAKRYSHRAALGFVTTRVLEAVMIFVGVLSILTVYTLRQDVAGTPGADTGALLTTGHAFVAMHDWTFLLGPGFVVGIGNGLILGYLMYRSGLVPRGLAVLGMVGGALICLSGIAVLLGAFDKGSLPQGIATVPEFIWELSLGIYLIVKGFKPSPLIAVDAPTVGGLTPAPV